MSGQVSKWQNKTPPEDGVWSPGEFLFQLNSASCLFLAGGGGGDTSKSPLLGRWRPHVGPQLLRRLGASLRNLSFVVILLQLFCSLQSQFKQTKQDTFSFWHIAFFLLRHRQQKGRPYSQQRPDPHHSLSML